VHRAHAIDNIIRTLTEKQTFEQFVVDIYSPSISSTQSGGLANSSSSTSVAVAAAAAAAAAASSSVAIKKDLTNQASVDHTLTGTNPSTTEFTKSTF
jgi:hypothetical protein